MTLPVFESMLKPDSLRQGINAALDIFSYLPVSKEEVDALIKLSRKERKGEANMDEFLELVTPLSRRVSDWKVRPTGELVLRARQLTKTYSSGGFTLQPINLDLQSGELTGLVGENGNGKTTLLRILAGELDKDFGEIEYFKVRAGIKPDTYAIRSSMAYIPQRIPRWYGFLEDNLHFAAATRGIYGFDNVKLVSLLMERLDLSRYEGYKWTQISSGYRTRFELARMLTMSPELLILDEPLANLDINAQQTFLHDLATLARSPLHPMAVIFSSQQLFEVERVADRIIFLKQGKCLFQDNVKKTAVPTEGTATAVPEAVVPLLELDGHWELAAVQQLFKDQPGIEVKSHNGLTLLQGAPGYEVLPKMLQAGLRITYFRDITHSTKRFF